MFTGNKTRRFEVTVLTHLDAAYNLARWIMNNDSDARDVVQIASLRALTYLDSLRGNEAKAWFLGIVRNSCMTALGERSSRITDLDIDALVQDDNELETLGLNGSNPEHELTQKSNRNYVNRVLSLLPVGYREVLILREMEEMDYEQMASVLDIPVGTVMSRLSRARASFKKAFLALNEGMSP